MGGGGRRRLEGGTIQVRQNSRIKERRRLMTDEAMELSIVIGLITLLFSNQITELQKRRSLFMRTCCNAAVQTYTRGWTGSNTDMLLA